VDLADQMIVAYPSERKLKKIWYKKQFRHLINQAVLNSYILFQKDNETNKLTHLAFRIKLMEGIIAEHHNGVAVCMGRGRPSLDETNPLRYDAGKENPTRRCKVCCSHFKPGGHKKTRKETRYFCEECDVALCPAPCFERYTRKHF
jgi:hypothetical protein